MYSKYLVEYQIVKAEHYKDGMEDGFRVYYWFPPDKEGLVVKSFITFNDKKLLKIWRNKMKKAGIQISENIPVIETEKGVAETSYDDFIIFTASNKKLVMNSEAFDYFFENIQ